MPSSMLISSETNRQGSFWENVVDLLLDPTKPGWISWEHMGI